MKGVFGFQYSDMFWKVFLVLLKMPLSSFFRGLEELFVQTELCGEVLSKIFIISGLVGKIFETKILYFICLHRTKLTIVTLASKFRWSCIKVSMVMLRYFDGQPSKS